jgi:hypothetical protein
MRKFWSKRPSPAMIVALIALFAALGGSAYAAKKIGSKEIKANAITTGKIRKNAVTTSKIKNSAITGAKLNEASLGTVPSATNAENAKNFSRYFTSGLQKASVGQQVALITVGPFTFIGRCSDAGGGAFRSAIYMITSQTGSNAYSQEHSGYYQNDFNPGTELQVDYGASDTGTQVAFWSSAYNSFAAESADGATLLEGNGNSAVRAFGADCAFQIAGFNNA